MLRLRHHMGGKTSLHELEKTCNIELHRIMLDYIMEHPKKYKNSQGTSISSSICVDYGVLLPPLAVAIH